MASRPTRPSALARRRPRCSGRRRAGGSGGFGFRTGASPPSGSTRTSRASYLGTGYGRRRCARARRRSPRGNQGSAPARKVGLEDYGALSVQNARHWTGSCARAALPARRRVRVAQPLQLPQVAAGGRAAGRSATVDRKRLFRRAVTKSRASTHPPALGPTATLESELREFFPIAAAPGLGWVDLRYQYVKAARLARLLGARPRPAPDWGDVTFHDELSLGRVRPQPLRHQFVPSARNLQLEFRFSITRDLLKLSLFHDLALFAVASRVQDG